MLASSFVPWQLSFDPQHQLLRQRWSGQYSMQVFRQAMQQALQVVHELRVRRWLFELEGLPHLRLEDQAWLSAALRPGLPLLPVQQLAIVFSSNLYNQLVAESIMATDARLNRCDMQFFADAAAAGEWLTDPATATLGAAQWRLSA
ncbi:hypothetical protein [Hymenobacter sp. B81]|uniref:hypothetical protein n=1 Tax=Hymenobacter sp. B81 TaxID=3344878 RepID=UPI0037DCEC9F